MLPYLIIASNPSRPNRLQFVRIRQKLRLAFRKKLWYTLNQVSYSVRLITASGERCDWPFFIPYVAPALRVDFSPNPDYNDQRPINALLVR